MSNQTTITRVRRPGIMWASAEKYAAEHGIELVDAVAQETPSRKVSAAALLFATGRYYAGNATNRTSGRE